MRVLRVDAHGSAGFREQASALHGSGGTMDFGHSNAAVAYTEGLMLLNPAFEELQDSDHTGHFQTIQSSLTSAPDPPSHRSESPVAFDHGYAHIAAAPYGGQHPFYLPQDHYQSLGHRQHQAQDRENVYLRVSRASRSSAKVSSLFLPPSRLNRVTDTSDGSLQATRAAGGDAQESQGA
ncbi:hypothetical protein BCR35DRAFT_215403 [Leucosporidium creatinivorum]|uniref:Uncharacterized protein n=1 Tax=Leucosporidium creatinivorum TaxID=106004 RepID=A0A1Y2DAC2_9BASI|nr:hypothetical protein BCR35DRAFT_215403 [Leucosporidium creatinivorum]